jgi:hypothetical protein
LFYSPANEKEDSMFRGVKYEGTRQETVYFPIYFALKPILFKIAPSIFIKAY